MSNYYKPINNNLKKDDQLLLNRFSTYVYKSLRQNGKKNKEKTEKKPLNQVNDARNA